MCAFAPGVVKTGLTPRLKPIHRVIELRDAFVHFRFAVHAWFFAEDAVAIGAMPHRHFVEQ